jgi:hypothetical protein
VPPKALHALCSPAEIGSFLPVSKQADLIIMILVPQRTAHWNHPILSEGKCAPSNLVRLYQNRPARIRFAFSSMASFFVVIDRRCPCLSTSSLYKNYIPFLRICQALFRNSFNCIIKNAAIGYLVCTFFCFNQLNTNCTSIRKKRSDNRFRSPDLFA